MHHLGLNTFSYCNTNNASKNSVRTLSTDYVLYSNSSSTKKKARMKKKNQSIIMISYKPRKYMSLHKSSGYGFLPTTYSVGVRRHPTLRHLGHRVWRLAVWRHHGILLWCTRFYGNKRCHMHGDVCIIF